jgi:hypothetical protein
MQKRTKILVGVLALAAVTLVLLAIFQLKVVDTANPKEVTLETFRRAAAGACTFRRFCGNFPKKPNDPSYEVCAACTNDADCNLKSQYVLTLRQDWWKHDVHIDFEGNNVEISSAGPDGKFGHNDADDDIRLKLACE